MNGPAQGNCLCGAVRFSAQLPPKWVAHCHCTRCQRAHGAAVVTWAGFEAAAVSIDDSTQSLRWHVAAAGGSRGFCGQCGSPMFFKSERWAGELHVARALFATPLDCEPQAHVYYNTHADWLQVADQLPKRGEI